MITAAVLGYCLLRIGVSRKQSITGVDDPSDVHAH